MQALGLMSGHDVAPPPSLTKCHTSTSNDTCLVKIDSMLSQNQECSGYSIFSQASSLLQLDLLIVSTYDSGAGLFLYAEIWQAITTLVAFMLMWCTTLINSLVQ